MKLRIVSLLLALALILSLVPIANAQGGAPCYNLPQADCDVLLAAQANTEENLNSFQMQFMVDLTIGGLGTLGAMFGGASGAGSTGPDQFVLHVEGEGPFAANPEASAADAMNAFAMALNMNASAVMGTDEQAGPLSFVIVDGVYYQIEPPIDLSEMGITGVVGITLQQVMTLAMEQAGVSGLPGGAMTPDNITGVSPDAMMEQFAANEGLMQALQNMPAAEDIPGFISLERLANEDVLGQAMSPFSLSVDLSTLFASQEFQAVLQQAVSGAAESDPSAAQMGMMIPMLLSGVTLTADVTQWVGSDQFIHKLSVDINGSLDLATLMQAGGSQSQNAPQIPPITLALHFEVTLDQLNGTFDIAAPEGATILTDEQLQLLMQAAQ